MEFRVGLYIMKTWKKLLVRGFYNFSVFFQNNKKTFFYQNATRERERGGCKHEWRKKGNRPRKKIQIFCFIRVQSMHVWYSFTQTSSAYTWGGSAWGWDRRLAMRRLGVVLYLMWIWQLYLFSSSDTTSLPFPHFNNRANKRKSSSDKNEYFPFLRHYFIYFNRWKKIYIIFPPKMSR